MKPGDIVTHCYHGRAHGIMGQEKQLVLKEVVEAQRHGIIFDCAHGRSHFSFPMIEKALDQGFLPDTISTDLTFTSATQGPVWDLPTTMSKLLHFGMSLDDLVMRSTAAPAKILGYEGTVGTLAPGANADIAAVRAARRQFPIARQRRQHRHRKAPADRPDDDQGRAHVVRAGGRINHASSPWARKLSP